MAKPMAFQQFAGKSKPRIFGLLSSLGGELGFVSHRASPSISPRRASCSSSLTDLNNSMSNVSGGERGLEKMKGGEKSDEEQSKENRKKIRERKKKIEERKKK